MKGKYNFKMRSAALLAAVLFIISIFIADLFRIQVVKADEYSAKKIALSSANTKIQPLRGEILDRNGKPLVYNVRSNTVYIDASFFPSAKEKEKRNEILLALIRLFEQEGAEYNSSLPIEKQGDSFVFAENSAADKKYLIRKNYLNLNSYATAENCFDALKDFYALENMTDEEALKVAGVYFLMTKGEFSVNNPFTFAEKVPDGIVMIIKEQSRFYAGAEVRIDTEREFYDGTIAPHIIGIYDYIDADEYKRRNDEYKAALENPDLTEDERQELSLTAYGMNDKVGKFGLESSLEETLRGKKGILTTFTNGDGSKRTEVTTPPVNGNNVILTIDGDFQKRVQDILAEKAENTKEHPELSAAGSVVVLDVKDFSILACASYPNYDLSTYKDNIVALNKDDRAPLWNRALRSTYAPGSTVKPAVSIAGLEEGIISPSSRIRCTINYTYYKGFKCMNVGGHGGADLTVDQAIRYSCNIFFYEVGRRLGIDRLSGYLSEFGLGSKTGVELTEAEGVVAGPEERTASGGMWQPGDTVQAAIGQSDNQFTPIQLASYVATLANGGTRMRAHFVDSIKSADYSQTVMKNEPVVLHKFEASPASFAAVKKGMTALADTYIAFRDLPFKVACKTGTAQAKRRVNGAVVDFTNGFMISYAPAENPQIAVAIAVENGTSSGIAACVGDIYRAYFSEEAEIIGAQTDNTILR